MWENKTWWGNSVHAHTFVLSSYQATRGHCRKFSALKDKEESGHVATCIVIRTLLFELIPVCMLTHYIKEVNKCISLNCKKNFDRKSLKYKLCSLSKLHSQVVAWLCHAFDPAQPRVVWVKIKLRLGTSGSGNRGFYSPAVLAVDRKVLHSFFGSLSNWIYTSGLVLWSRCSALPSSSLKALLFAPLPAAASVT